MNKLSSVQDVDRCVNEKQNSDSGEMQTKASSPSTDRVPKDIQLRAGKDEAWPLVDVLRKLAFAAEHLGMWHDCDHHGYEEIIAAKNAAYRYLADPSTQDTKSAEGGHNPDDTVAGSVQHKSESESSPSPSVSGAEDQNSGEAGKRHRGIPRTESLKTSELSAAREPKTLRVTLHLCELCIAGAGGECHVPGCILYLNRAPDLPLSEFLYEIAGPRTEEAAEICAEMAREAATRAAKLRSDSYDGVFDIGAAAQFAAQADALREAQRRITGQVANTLASSGGSSPER